MILDGCILIDCGVPYKKLEPYVGRLRLVLLTHIHGDHFNPATIRRLHKERPALRFGCCEWLVEPLLVAGVAARCIDVYIADLEYNYGIGMSISPFWLAHDVENCGYRFLFADGKKAIYATDTGSLESIIAQGYDLYMIEANHLESELAERIRRKTEAGEFVYETRVIGTHLSREAADLWLAMNAGPNSKVVYLHGHEERKEQT